ncbi:MAG TPA: T9SS type A sorting domain-containing protein, partial [Chitinophagales bacterium]|nr:T9SS type A sorting domain-containing protein [Chitinophagales bacterium]
TLNERGHTNFAISQQAYPVLKRNNSASAWTHQGVTITGSQVAAGGTVTVPNYGLSSFSDFAIGFGNAVLPVELSAFTGWNEGTINELAWQTESESNSRHFELERSYDGAVFETIALVEAAGYSTLTIDYTYTDNSPRAGFNYYRLKAVDLDGSYEYSNAIALEVKTKDAQCVLYPNPTVGNVYLQIDNRDGQTLRVELSDASGRVLATDLVSGVRLNQTVGFDLSNLPNGWYGVNVKNQNNEPVYGQKIYKMR